MSTETALVAQAVPELPLVAPENGAPAKTDAAQARVEHVASVLSTAYAKASTLVLTAEESAKLLAPFPDEAVQRGAGGDQNLLYIAHAWVRERLLEVFGVGQWSLIGRRTWLDEREGFMYVDCVLVARGCYVGEAIGAQRYTPNNKRMNYSDAAEGAQSEALRRIAGKYLGCGIQVWKSSYCEAWKQRQSGAGGGARAMDAPAQRTGTTVKPAAPTPKGGAEKPADGSARSGPTDESRAKMIAALVAGPGGENRAMTTDYFRKLGQLMETEEIEDLPLRYVPCTQKQMNDLSSAVVAFEAGVDATPAFEPNAEPEPAKVPQKRSKTAQDASEGGEHGLGIEDTRLRCRGVIQAVSEKSGVNKKGKAYVKAGVKIGDAWFNTFDTKLTAEAKRCKQSGETVTMYYKEGEFGKEAIELVANGTSSEEGAE